MSVLILYINLKICCNRNKYWNSLDTLSKLFRLFWQERQLLWISVCFPAYKVPLGRVYSEKINCSIWGPFFSFYTRPLFRREASTILTKFLSLQVYLFPLIMRETHDCSSFFQLCNCPFTRLFFCCSSLFVRLWFHMCYLLCPYLFLISPSFGASGGLCFVFVAFPGYLRCRLIPSLTRFRKFQWLKREMATLSGMASK